ncbi:acyl carrier protein [Pendulispora rubella]|uniref:Acyl carrier protein n=1 Tax=Pendulispora rubella TaxID=2741070 RepID=A0ABZ2KVE6_9BACT
MSGNEVTKDEIFGVVRGHILEILTKLAPADVRSDVSMKTLGANSIDRVEVIVKSMADLALKIPLMEFSNVSNIGELVDVFYEKMQVK